MNNEVANLIINSGEKGLDMKYKVYKMDASIVEYLVTKCPYCGKSVLESGFNVMDMTAPDFEEENEITCPHCDNDFIAIINQP